jgi:FeS assembly SUF system protein
MTCNIKTTLVLHNLIVDKIKEVFDPEIPINVWDLGLIYHVDIEPSTNINITMTLTSPNCPSAQDLPVMIKNKVKELDEVKDVNIIITWDPPWDPSKISEEARYALGMDI